MRQAAALERSAGAVLFERRPDGVRLTPAGLALLRHARMILDSVAAAERDLTGSASQSELVRVGVFMSAGAVILPIALTRLAATSPQVTLTTREGTTPALARALRAGSIDIAMLTSRPPYRPLDGESPRLHIDAVEGTELLVGVPAADVFAGRASVHVDELVDAPWIATPSSNSEPLLGVWPGLPGRPRIVHTARDWLTKLELVASGFGVTTVPSRMSTVLPSGVRLLHVDGVPPRSAAFSWRGFPADRPQESRPSPEHLPRPPDRRRIPRRGHKRIRPQHDQGLSPQSPRCGSGHRDRGGVSIEIPLGVVAAFENSCASDVENVRPAPSQVHERPRTCRSTTPAKERSPCNRPRSPRS
ncbi:LysR substrate-binding domain-containing protein [Streptomyces sp. NEAU-YJ-81]|uniref:LysR substrate-binding domain-containing protein n=1 Tax=Streptomyces sp. NEAU-YJ-81 TaxID=2820288 RepID=UPI0027E02C03|nr:LysR substrate-binding domain-containing protein [Streptomyces sp. NEAU-YJ-81]